jgi:redox-sensing transcriptional repressor
VGTHRGPVEVFHIDELEERFKSSPVDIAIIAVPADVAQAIADRVVACGVTGIMNFVPKRLIVPPGIKVHYVDLAIEIESLSYYLR